MVKCKFKAISEFWPNKIKESNIQFLVRPSMPGDLFACMLFSALNMSVKVMGASQISRLQTESTGVLISAKYFKRSFSVLRDFLVYNEA